MTGERQIVWNRMESPLGPLLLVGMREEGRKGEAERLRVVGLPGGRRPMEPAPAWRHDPSALTEARRQLDEYFAGERRRFDLDLEPVGTDFQLLVWRELARVPYGATATYGEIAERIGRPSAVRAVGAANGRNPLPVVVPCHRVVGADGSLTGFGGGLEAKRLLLDLEAGATEPETVGQRRLAL